MGKVLIVDDRQNMRMSLQNCLMAENHEVAVASDASEARRFLSGHGCDVAVIDNDVPGVDGADLFQMLRTMVPDVQVVIMTGAPSVESAAKAVRAGACDYLIKPVPRTAIVCSVAAAARIKTLADEKRRCQQELSEKVQRLTLANDKLHKLISVHDDLVQSMCHDLKSPLFVVLAAPEVIRSLNGGLSLKQLGMLSQIEDAGRRLLDMINWSLSNLQLGKGMHLHRETVDLLSLVHEVFSRNALLMEMKRLSLDMLIDGHRPSQADTFVVQGNRRLCYGMCEKLLRNAMEASPVETSVAVRFLSTDGRRVSISNRGAVPETMRDRFFEKFTTSGKDHGTGLGAYSARLIARLHGADIRLDTSDPDATTVIISFPEGHGCAWTIPERSGIPLNIYASPSVSNTGDERIVPRKDALQSGGR